MNKLFFFILLGFTSTISAQGECLVAYVSSHHVINQTSDTVVIWVNNKNQKSFSTKGPTKFDIPPGANVKISSLEWAEEFKDPTIWYVFKNETAGLTNLCDKENWKFEKLTETTGLYNLTLTKSSVLPCVPVNESYFNADNIVHAQDFSERIVDIAEQDATFPGGTSEMIKWLKENLEYPIIAKEAGISGIVYVEFIVEKNGELTGLKILKSPHDALSTETLRLIKAMPNWEPGMMGNQVVRSRYRLPVSFRI